MDSTITGLRTPRPRRNRHPPRIFSPSVNNRTETRDYELNITKAKNKKQAAKDREALVGKDKAGNIIITFNTQTYDIYITALTELLERLERESPNIYKITNRNAKEQKDINTENIIHITKRIGSTVKTVTVNTYHTTSRMMVNGKGKDVFMEELHPQVTNNIYQRAGSQRSTLAFLDQITGDLINITTTPRAQQRPHNNNTDPLPDSRAGETHNRSNTEPERDPAPLSPRAQTGREGESDGIIPVTNTPQPTNLGNICLQNEDTDPKLVTAAGGSSPQNVNNNVHHEWENTDPKQVVEDRGVTDINPTVPKSIVDIEVTRAKSPINHNTPLVSETLVKGHTHTNVVDLDTPQREDGCPDSNIGDTQNLTLCIICDQPAISEAVQCSGCEKWLHFTCEHLSEQDIRTYDESGENIYTCSLCYIQQEEDRDILNSNTKAPSTQRAKSKTKTTAKGPQKPKSQNQQKKQEASRQTDEYDKKLIEMRTEILRLENIINEQRDTIRTLKIKVAADTKENANSSTPNEHIMYRIQNLEHDNLKMRLELLERHVFNDKHSSCTNNNTQNGNPGLNSFLSTGRASHGTPIGLPSHLQSSVPLPNHQNVHPSSHHQSSVPLPNHQNVHPSSHHQSSVPLPNHQNVHPSSHHQSSVPLPNHQIIRAVYPLPNHQVTSHHQSSVPLPNHQNVHP